MGRTQRGNVEVADQLFVSYSHADAALIDPILKLLRFRNRVFSDHEIEPGQRWREAIERAITESSSVVVLWCCHSAASQEVEHEITFAVASAKPLVPILLCPAPVGSALSEFQWIDASSIMKHVCRCVDVGYPTGTGDVTKEDARDSPRSQTRVSVFQFRSVLERPQRPSRSLSPGQAGIARSSKLNAAAKFIGGLLSVGACVAITQFMVQSWPVTVAVLMLLLLLCGSTLRKTRASPEVAPDSTPALVLASTIRAAARLSKRGELQRVLHRARQL